MGKLRAAAPIAASALLLVLAFPPFNLWPLVAVALVPWLQCLRACTNRGAWKRGYLFGLLFALVQLFWLFQLTARWTDSVVLGFVPWLAASFAMAVYFGLLAMLIRVCWLRGWVLAIPVLWAGIEVFRSYVPVLAFPWGLLASPLWKVPMLIQAAHFGTIYLVSAWLVGLNLVWVLALQKSSKKLLATMLFATGSVALLSAVWTVVPLGTRTVRVLVAQPGVNMAFGDPHQIEFQNGLAVDRFVRQGVAEKADLLVLPEGIARIKTLPPADLPFHLDPGLPTLFGGQRGSGKVYQSAFAYDGQWQAADKTRLVIFGEFVPGRDVLPFLGAFHLPTGDLSAGEQGVAALKMRGLEVGPLLCFEGLFPDLSYRQAQNGARLLAIMSIDDWFMGSTAPDNLMAASVWRAVETGLPVARSASLGHTFAVDGHGNLIQTAPLKASEALTVNLPITDHPTTFQLLPIFPFLSLVSLLLIPFVAKLKPP